MSDQEEIAALKEQLTEAHNEIEQLNAEFEAEKENVTRSEAAMQQLQANFESAMEAYRQGQLEVEAIRVKFEERKAEIDYLQSELLLVCNEKSELKHRVNELERQVRDLEHETTSLKVENTRLKESVTSQAEMLKKMEIEHKENQQPPRVRVPGDLIDRLKSVKDYVRSLNQSLEPYISS